MSRRGTALLISAAVAIAVTTLLAVGFGEAVEMPMRDLALRLLPPKAPRATIVVAIDERSLNDPDLGRWPWPRARLAQVVNRIADAHAAGVVLDVLLDAPQAGDESLAEALKRVPSVAVAVLDPHDNRWVRPAMALREAATSAHGNFEVDRDGIMRRLATTKQNQDLPLTALSVEAARIVTSAPVPVGRSIAPAFRVRAGAIPQISAAAVLHDGRVAPQLRDKIVFIGSTAFAIGDRFLTPTSGRSLDPGVSVHAAATESIIRGETIRPVPPILGGLAAGAITATVIQPRRSRARRLAIAGAIVVAILAGGMLLLDRAQVAIPFVTLLLTTVVSAGALEANVVAGTLRQHIEYRMKEAEAKRLLAHELRTPLASMRGLSQLLGGFDLSDAERQRVASLLESEAGKLQSLVHTLLDLERLPLRDFGSTTSVVDLGELVSARVDFLRASSDRTLLVSATPGVAIRADPALIERVIDNLVGNALKYTPTPSPVIVRVDRDRETAVLKVDDRGPGIAEAERARIFDRFFRGTTAAGTTGLGLGLSLVAEIARWHGGSASVEPAAGGGSSFRLRLPLASALARTGVL